LFGNEQGLSGCGHLVVEMERVSHVNRRDIVVYFELSFFNGFKYDIEGDRLVWFEYNDDKDTYELHIR
jgi:hypothetical protein